MTRTESADVALPEHARVTDALRDAGIAADASELHGALCGYIAGGGRPDRVEWLGQLQLEAERDAHADRGTSFDTLRTATLAQFDDPACGLHLLLPDDETSLPERADALLAWCRGFLGGFGLAAPPAEALSAESAEALEDMGRIAAADLGYEGSEEDEDALAQIVEFVRMTPLLLHADCVSAGRRRRKAH
ncbi:MAG: UPF0149 family protein [Proteobacteria bacterium]|nr:UPF0149 family protein [Pseudomonadota bacterium]